MGDGINKYFHVVPELPWKKQKDMTWNWASFRHMIESTITVLELEGQPKKAEKPFEYWKDKFDEQLMRSVLRQNLSLPRSRKR